MKKRFGILILFVEASLLNQLSGGEFINLGFDEPHLDNLQIDPELLIPYGTPTDLVPGWVITQNGIPISRVWYYNGGNIPPVTLSATVLGGFVVQYNGRPIGAGLKSTQIAQSGTIPEWAVTLEFFWGGRSNDFDAPLRINGEVVPIRFDPQLPADYFADVSRWAGQEVLLSLNFPSGSSSHIDRLRFTVPEPSLLGLAVVGTTSLFWAFRRSRT